MPGGVLDWHAAYALNEVESRWHVVHPACRLENTTSQPPRFCPFVPPPFYACSYVLTQFQSHTLNSHIAACYPPMKFGPPDQQAWVDVLAAQQTVTEREW